MWKTRVLCTHVSKSGINVSGSTPARVAGLLAANLKELKVKELVFAADTLARTSVNDLNFWSQLCDRIKPDLKTTNVADILKVIHALAKVPYKKVSFLNAVDRIVLQRHACIEARALMQYFIDSNRLNHLEPNTFKAVIGSKLNMLSEFHAFDLCFMLHIASKLQLWDPSILDNVSDELCNNAANYEYLCKDKLLVAMVIRSLAFLQQHNDLFKKLVYDRLPGCIYAFGAQEMCNVIFSLVVGLQDETYNPAILDIFRVLLDRVSDNLKDMVDIEVNQLAISLFHLRYKMPHFEDKYQMLLDNIIQLDLQFTPSTSKMQYKLSKLLDHLKVQYTAEKRIGPYVMDYVLPQLQIAIEVNGYSHFYHQSRDFNAITRLKYSIVESLGWKVLSVNYFDWKNRSRQNKLEYLSSAIHALYQA